jgi:predicted permease
VAGLREGARGRVGGRERLRPVLVAAQVAASVVLVASAGLLLRALWRVQSVDPGFRTEGVLTLRTPLSMTGYAQTERRAQLYERVLAQARALPGVTQAAYISFLPMTMRGGIWPVRLEGAPPVTVRSETASLRFVTPGFFEALDIPLRAGRDVGPQDTAEAPFVAVVSESFARRHWPGADPLGRRFFFAFQERTVAGVVGDVRVRGLERASEPQVYLPYRQVPDGGLAGYAPKDLVVRVAGDPLRLAAAVRRIVQAADPELPITDVRPLAAVVEEETAARRTQLAVLGLFAAVALLLAGLGLHGLLSFAVSQRVPEIGLRLALGAQPRSILQMVLGDAARIAAVGSAVGLLLAYAAGRGLEALLAGVRPGDLPTFALATALALAMTLTGSLLPALRALRVDPTTALRADA